VRGNEEDDLSRYRLTLRKKGVMKIERGTTRQHFVEYASDLNPYPANVENMATS
jgi:hypothetical protein